LRNALADRRHRFKVAVAGLTAALLMVVPAAPAGAQQSPAQNATADRASALTDPAVVFITTVVGWSVRLTWADSNQISGRNNYDLKGRLNYASGSGFVVNPNGTIVTASHVIEPDEDEIRNYAANQIFFTGKLSDYKLGDNQDPYEQYSIPNNSFLNSLLQQCYSGVACSFSIKPAVQVYSPVAIAGVSAPKGAPARVLKSTGFEETDVAVIQIDGNNMPTVPLADTAGSLTSGQPLTALGFAGSVQQLPTGVTEPTKAFGRVSSVRSAGSSRVVQVDIDIEGGMSGGPVVNDAGKVIGLTSFSFTEGSARTQGFLRTVDDIKSVIQGAGAQTARGEVDRVFEQAMGLFWARHYSAALPLFQNAINLYDGHPAAKTYLAQAQAKAGGPEDVPVEEPSTFPVGLVIGVLAGVLVLVGLVVLVLVLSRRRKARPAPQPGVEAWSAQPHAPMAVGPAPQPPFGPQPVAHAGPAAAPTSIPELPQAPSEAPTAPITPATPAPVTAAAPVVGAIEARPDAAVAPAAPPAPAPAPAGGNGAAPAGRRFCSSCGSAQEGQGRFCTNCGNQFDRAASPLEG
jgi:serine protease Do